MACVHRRSPGLARVSQKSAEFEKLNQYNQLLKQGKKHFSIRQPVSLHKAGSWTLRLVGRNERSFQSASPHLKLTPEKIEFYLFSRPGLK